MTEAHPQSLFKYLPAEAAMAVLEHGRLRWSAPGAFDDPFELDAAAALDFDASMLERAAVQTIAAAVFARQTPPGLPGHAITSAVRRWRAQRRFSSEEEVQTALRQVLPALVERHETGVRAILEDWKAFASRVRLLCLCERHNDAALWHRYADRHRGVVLRLACEPEGSFAEPKAVRYVQRRPRVTTLREQVEVLVGQARPAAQEHFVERLLAKSRADADEREWRCFRHVTPPEDAEDVAPGPADASEELPFAPAELQTVYLGARLPEPARERLLAVVAERYPATRVQAAHLAPREFSLEFEPVGHADPAAGSAEDEASEAAEAVAQPASTAAVG